jgi:molybdenum cofactor cytidylyltransferase
VSSNKSNVAGLILAAGESRRMGSPKALLEYRGKTFLETLCGLFAARCSPVIVVLGADAERIRAAAGRAATFLVNERYREGQTTSMQRGLRAVPPDASGVLFTLVDHPAVAGSSIDALLAEPPSLLRVPRYNGRRGHPVFFSSSLIPEFLAIPPDGAARDVVRAHAADTRFLDLDDPGIVADIDDPAAYQALLESAR